MSEDLPLEQHEEKMKEQLGDKLHREDLKGFSQLYLESNPHHMERMEELIDSGNITGLKNLFDEMHQEVDDLAHEILGA